MPGLFGLSYSDDQLFGAVNAVLPAWALLAVAPRWAGTRAIVTTVVAAHALLYCALIARELAALSVSISFSDMSSLDGLMKMFSGKGAVFAGWVHYCVVDLWTGKWVAEDAAARGVPRLLMLPVLFLCMMFAPAGLLAYLFIRAMFSGRRAAAPAGGEKRD